MANIKASWSDDRIDRLLGNLLRTGVVISSIVILWGGVLFLVAEGGSRPNDAVFHGEPARLENVVGVFQSAIAGRPMGIIQAGVLLLLATPIMRVAFSVFAFAMQRDWTYVAITLFALGVLLYSVSATW